MVKTKRYIKFLGSRLGCKLQDQKHYKHLLPNDDDVETIIEGFGGSFSLLREYYKDSNKQLHINDNDEKLIKHLTFIKNTNKQVLINLIKIWNENKGKLYRKDNSIMDKFNETCEDENFREFIINSHILKKFGVIQNISLDNEDVEALQQLLNKCKITNDDITRVFEQYHNDEKAFIFLDPPYLDSDNTYYTNMKKYSKGKQLADNTIFYIQVLEFLKTAKCKCLCIVNKTAITSYIYKDYIKGEYNKTYSLSKNMTTHLIISNY